MKCPHANIVHCPLYVAAHIGLDGWTWALYSPSGSLPARCVLTSPDSRVHIGREGRSVSDAVRAAVAAAINGAAQ